MVQNTNHNYTWTIWANYYMPLMGRVLHSPVLRVNTLSSSPHYIADAYDCATLTSSTSNVRVHAIPFLFTRHNATCADATIVDSLIPYVIPYIQNMFTVQILTWNTRNTSIRLLLLFSLRVKVSLYVLHLERQGL